MILALTAVWYHNLELIALTATFAGCVLAAKLEAAVKGRTLRLTAVAAGAIASAVAFGGFAVDRSSSPDSSRPLSEWTRTPRSASAVALDDEAARVRAPQQAVGYARLGGNDDDAHAEFIHDNLVLACPVFHQYTYSANLDQALACIRKRRPELLLVSSSFAEHHLARTRRWDAFVTAGEEILRARYTEALRMESGQGTLEVWRRR
jgi:hypothetical protein